MPNVEIMNFSFQRSSSMTYAFDRIRKLTIASGHGCVYLQSQHWGVMTRGSGGQEYPQATYS